MYLLILCLIIILFLCLLYSNNQNNIFSENFNDLQTQLNTMDNITLDKVPLNINISYNAQNSVNEVNNESDKNNANRIRRKFRNNSLNNSWLNGGMDYNNYSNIDPTAVPISNINSPNDLIYKINNESNNFNSNGIRRKFRNNSWLNGGMDYSNIDPNAVPISNIISSDNWIYGESEEIDYPYYV